MASPSFANLFNPIGSSLFVSGPREAVLAAEAVGSAVRSLRAVGMRRRFVRSATFFAVSLRAPFGAIHRYGLSLILRAEYRVGLRTHKWLTIACSHSLGLLSA